MVLDRTDDEELLTLPNPKTRRQFLMFHPSEAFFTEKKLQVYGYDGIILEVSDMSQVVSVTLF
jgi:hypothetical protein